MIWKNQKSIYDTIHVLTTMQKTHKDQITLLREKKKKKKKKKQKQKQKKKQKQKEKEEDQITHIVRSAHHLQLYRCCGSLDMINLPFGWDWVCTFFLMSRIGNVLIKEEVRCHLVCEFGSGTYYEIY